MLLASEGARPVGFNAPPCGICSTAVNPVGVLAADPSGTTDKEGSNRKLLHPSNPVCSPAAFSRVYWASTGFAPGVNHDSASTVVRTPAGPVHDVGNVKNGVCEVCSCVAHGLSPDTSRERQVQPRSGSWRGSPGTPQSVTRAPKNGSSWVMLLTLTTTP